MTIHVLLIGGANDGQRITLESVIPNLKMTVPRTEPVDFSRSAIEQLEIEVYLPEEIKGKYKSFIVYVHEDLTVDDMIHRMIEFYKAT